MKTLLVVMTVAALLVGLPLLGAWLGGLPLDKVLEFPPRAQYVQHAAFSWFAFAFYAAFTLAWALPFAVRAIRAARPVRPFPWWGWAGILFGAVAWVLAWTRFPWFSALQPHTFTPLWLALIVVVNALTFRRTGRCLMLSRTRFFLLLFAASAFFWWFFEYLNRFVQNWDYSAVAYGPLEYFIAATVPFSTVLPAVLSVREWLLSFAVFEKFRSFLPTALPHPRRLAWFVLLITGLSLVCIGIFPDYLFSQLWVAPLLVIVSVQVLLGRRHVFSDVVRGDWRPVLSVALAALVCGVFWEMWNYYSLAQWKYHVPWVSRFFIFEMPLIGFAGYLPFGLECAALGDVLDSAARKASRV